MKKTSRLLGAVVLSAALAAGTAIPAFAAPQTGADGKYESAVEWDKNADGSHKAKEVEDGADGASDTPVYIDVNRSNINVAVPMELRLVAETAGGSLICPTTGVYAVENWSTNAPVYINKVEVEYNAEVNADGANWALVQDATLVGDGVEAADAALGNLLVELSAPAAQDTTADSTPAVGDTYTLKVGAENAKVPTRAKAWKIAKAGLDGDNVIERTFPLNFTENCKSSIVQDADAANLLSQGDAEAGKTAADAFKLKYTISTSRPKA